MSRIASVIGDVYVGYQVPEYTSYSDVLQAFKSIIPLPSVLDAEDGFKLDVPQLKKDIKHQGISVVLASNPRNPTGQCVKGADLEDLISITHSKHTTLVLDEFYSWYQYPDESKGEVFGKSVSAAEYVEDVEDPVIILDGLTCVLCLRSFEND